MFLLLIFFLLPFSSTHTESNFDREIYRLATGGDCEHVETVRESRAYYFDVPDDDFPPEPKPEPEPPRSRSDWQYNCNSEHPIGWDPPDPLDREYSSYYEPRERPKVCAQEQAVRDYVFETEEVYGPLYLPSHYLPCVCDVLFNHHQAYAYPSFVARIERFPGYEEFIEKTHEKYHNDSAYKKKIDRLPNRAGCFFKHHVCRAVKKIQQKREQRARDQERRFDEHRDPPDRHELDELQQEFEERLSYYDPDDPDEKSRIKQLEQRIEHVRNYQPDGPVREKAYELNQDTQEFLDYLDLDPEIFTRLSGNDLQQAVHQEIVNCTRRAATIHAQNTWGAELFDLARTAGNFLGAANVANRLEHYDTAYAFVDFCEDVLSLATGLATSPIKVGAQLRQAVEHPIDTVKNIGSAVEAVGYSLGRALVSVITHPERVPDQVRSVAATIAETLSTKLSDKEQRKELLTECGSVLGEALTMGYLSRAVHAGKMATIARLQEGQAARPLLLSKGVLANCVTSGSTTMQQIFSKAGRMVAKASSSVRRCAWEKFYKITPETIKRCFKGEALPKFLRRIKGARCLEESDVSLISVCNFEKNYQKYFNALESIEGACAKNGPLTQALKSEGAAYEVIRAYNLQKSGVKIKEMGKYIRGAGSAREFDIVIEGVLIECKNVDWSKCRIDQLLSQFGMQIKIAREMGYEFELHSRRLVPHRVKLWLKERGANFYEGL